ncbi:MAG: hypothetical protein AAB358_02995 [Patescibacteria group bacterium]
MKKARKRKPTPRPSVSSSGNAPKPKEHLLVTVVGGQINITDYSLKDDRWALLALLAKMGIKPIEIRESHCG